MSFLSSIKGILNFYHSGPLGNFYSRKNTSIPFKVYCFTQQLSSIFLSSISIFGLTLITLTGGYDIDCSKTATFVIVNFPLTFKGLVLPLFIMLFSVGLSSTIKLFIRYPALVPLMMTGAVFAPISHESICQLSLVKTSITY